MPMRVLKVSIPYLRSPSTSGRSFVMAMTVAKVMTEHVINLHMQQILSQSSGAVLTRALGLKEALKLQNIYILAYLKLVH